MPLLNTANKMFVGGQPVAKVYLGNTQVWSSAPPLPPADPIPVTTGLVTQLDASNYTPGVWSNSGGGPAVTFQGSPHPTVSANTLNGRPLVRFKTGEGRVRSAWPYPPHDWTLIYVTKWLGPAIGRSFSVQYPPSNFLVGTHTSSIDTLYNNGTWLYAPGWSGGWPAAPGSWRMYGADSNASQGAAFLINGVQSGPRIANIGAQEGFYNGWGLSGYGAGTEETLDIEVAELVLYNRQLSEYERKQVEVYLRVKWGMPGATSLYDPATQAYLDATGLNAATYGTALDGLVTGLKTAGLWAKMAAIYPFVGGTEALHKWNLKDPRDLDAAYRLTFSQGVGGGTHSTALGYRPNAQGQGLRPSADGGYADSHLVPSVALLPNDTHLSLYSLADVPLVARCDMGCYNWDGSAGRFHIIARYLEGLYYYGASEAAATNVSVPASTGLFVSTRTGATAQAAYRNGAQIATSATPSIPLPNVPVHLGQINSWPTERSDLPFGFATIGLGLTQQNATDLYNIVQAFQTALGRQV